MTQTSQHEGCLKRSGVSWSLLVYSGIIDKIVFDKLYTFFFYISINILDEITLTT